jgi:membrane protease YdiL (CAAX protease family)
MQNENIPLFEQTENIPQKNIWKTSDTWIGLIILLLILAIFLTISVVLDLVNSSIASLLLIIPQLLMVIPIAIIFLWRKVGWKELGFFQFKWQDLALGLGLLLFVYFFSIINNLVMTMLGVVTQAETIFEVLDEIDSLAIFVLASTVLAPIFEEIFFRGFLFKGFRQKYGWKIALILSALIFSLFHGQVATLIPTFLLGSLFAYMHQRTGSILPSIIMHFLVNSVGTCGLLVVYQFGGI